MIRSRVEKIIIGKQRRLARSHEGKNRAALFHARISALSNRVAVRAAAGLAGLLETASFNVVEPAVIQTA